MPGLTQNNLTFGANYTDEASGFTGKLVGYTSLWNEGITVTLRGDDGEERSVDLSGLRFA